MTIQKAHFETDGENVRLSMPFAKVDQERRIVSGFATLDNIDKQNDIVTPEASKKAFEKFRGNIREMHQPIAIGKMVSFKEDKYFDPETKKFYSGIYVSAYISKGAQDAWEKVLDGTYSGFSIGGRMNKWDDGYDEKMDASVRIIKDYDLLELSLVDTPANQFANILSVQKNTDGETTVTGESVNTIIENVFWDKESGLITVSENETATHPITGSAMQNIGFVEKNDNEKINMIKFLVDSAKGINTSKMNKEDNMTEENITNDAAAEAVAEPVVEEIAPEADAVIESAETDVAVDSIEKSADADEDEKPGSGVPEEADDAAGEDDPEEAKKSDEVSADAVASLKDAVTSAFSEITSVIKSLNDELAELKKSVGDVSAKIADAESDFNNLGKRIDAVEADTAFRKSGDLGEIVQEPAMVEKSVWGGRFLNNSDLLK